MDKTIGISELRKDISSIVREVHETRSRYIVVQRSKPKAVLLSCEELEALEITAGKTRGEKIDQSQEKAKKGRSVSYEEYFHKKLVDRLK